MRALFIAGYIMLFTGCSRVQFAYKQLDWLIPYYVERRIELTDDQGDYLQQSVDYLLGWHCGAHLEDYAALLSDANDNFQRGAMSEKELQYFLGRITLYWKDIKKQVNPAVTHLLLSLSDSQIDEMFSKFRSNDVEWLEVFNTQTEQELRRDYQENMMRELERWIGPLQETQHHAVADWSKNFEPLGLVRLKMRRLWQAHLKDLLDHRNNTEKFYSGIEQLFLNPEAIYSEEYIKRLERNRKITLELVVYIGNVLDNNQREHLASMADSVSGDFIQLACTEGEKEEQAASELHDSVVSAHESL
jgi:hypothetical protein